MKIIFIETLQSPKPSTSFEATGQRSIALRACRLVNSQWPKRGRTECTQCLPIVYKLPDSVAHRVDPSGLSLRAASLDHPAIGYKRPARRGLHLWDVGLQLARFAGEGEGVDVSSCLKLSPGRRRGRGFLFPPECQLQLAFVCQLFAGRALDLEQDDAARLPDQADNGVRTGSLSTRGTSGVVVNLLADFEGVDWSFHPRCLDHRPQTAAGTRDRRFFNPT